MTSCSRIIVGGEELPTDGAVYGWRCDRRVMSIANLTSEQIDGYVVLLTEKGLLEGYAEVPAESCSALC